MENTPIPSPMESQDGSLPCQVDSDPEVGDIYVLHTSGYTNIIQKQQHFYFLKVGDTFLILKKYEPMTKYALSYFDVIRLSDWRRFELNENVFQSRCHKKAQL